MLAILAFLPSWKCTVFVSQLCLVIIFINFYVSYFYFYFLFNFMTVTSKPIMTDMLWATRLLINDICRCWSHQPVLFLFIFLIIPWKKKIFYISQKIMANKLWQKNYLMNYLKFLYICIFCNKHEIYYFYSMYTIKFYISIVHLSFLIWLSFATLHGIVVFTCLQLVGQTEKGGTEEGFLRLF